MHSSSISLAFAVLASLCNARIQSADRDPIEGKWYGTAGFAIDRIETGFEFERNAKGELEGFVYRPVMNFYGLPLPKPMTKSGNHYECREMAIALDLVGEKLTGTIEPFGAPIELARTDHLPSEVPVPKFPTGPGPRRRTQLCAAIYAPAAVRDGIAYVGTTGGMFDAIELKSASYVWSVAAGRPIFGEALATDDAVYFVCDDGYLRRLERSTGKELWRYDLGDARIPHLLPHFVDGIVPHAGAFDFDERASKPVLVDGVLYVGSGDGALHAVNAKSGERVWRFETKAKIRSTAAIDNELAIVGSFDDFVYAIDRSSGKSVWSRNTYGPFTSSPVLVDGRLIVGNRDGVLAALDTSDGATLWRETMWGSSVESDAVPGEGSIFYIGSSDLRRVSSIDAKDGRVLWRTDVFGLAWPRVAVTDKWVVAAAVGYRPYQIRHLGSLSVLDRKSGAIAWRWPMPEWPGSLLDGFAASPTIANDSIVIGGLDGTLYEFPLE